MVKEVEVKVFEERLYCDKCGAEMKHGGLVLCSYPPQHPYICPSCGWDTRTTKKYPNIVYKPVNEIKIMKAQESRIKATWNSIPNIIREKIERAIEWGQIITYFYKSSTPEVFKDIDATIAKLQLLGYTVEYGKVDIEDDNEAVGISTDTKLTIKW